MAIAVSINGQYITNLREKYRSKIKQSPYIILCVFLGFTLISTITKQYFINS